MVDELDAGSVTAHDVVALAERMPGMARTLVDLRARLDRLSAAVGTRAESVEGPAGPARAPTAHERYGTSSPGAATTWRRWRGPPSGWRGGSGCGRGRPGRRWCGG
ncbi:hypothetical protein [Actinomycetospora sp.]|uniref:hypothetical protein n=1 Tax=Actinomycetospora sp. TaxID=1872135 RepID=UPI002F40AB87